MEPGQDNQAWDTCCMNCFPCKGMLYMMPCTGYVDCVLKHPFNHIHYKDIRIPDIWHQFIADNYNLGPSKVHVNSGIEFMITERAVKIWLEILQQTGGIDI